MESPKIWSEKPIYAKCDTLPEISPEDRKAKDGEKANRVHFSSIKLEYDARKNAQSNLKAALVICTCQSIDCCGQY